MRLRPSHRLGARPGPRLSRVKPDMNSTLVSGHPTTINEHEADHPRQDDVRQQQIDRPNMMGRCPVLAPARPDSALLDISPAMARHSASSPSTRTISTAHAPPDPCDVLFTVCQTTHCLAPLFVRVGKLGNNDHLTLQVEVEGLTNPGRGPGRGGRWSGLILLLASVRRGLARHRIIDHRRVRVMMTSTTSYPGAGDVVLLKATATEYAFPRSEPAAASISRRVWSLNCRNVPDG